MKRKRLASFFKIFCEYLSNIISRGQLLSIHSVILWKQSQESKFKQKSETWQNINIIFFKNRIWFYPTLSLCMCEFECVYMWVCKYVCVRMRRERDRECVYVRDVTRLKSQNFFFVFRPLAKHACFLNAVRMLNSPVIFFEKNVD